jgi:hypothetical protein
MLYGRLSLRSIFASMEAQQGSSTVCDRRLPRVLLKENGSV